MDACIVPVKVTFDYNRVRMLLPIESFENYVKFFHHSQLDESLDTLTTSISLGGGRADYIEMVLMLIMCLEMISLMVSLLLSAIHRHRFTVTAGSISVGVQRLIREHVLRVQRWSTHLSAEAFDRAKLHP
jgi:hypothetical protein